MEPRFLVTLIAVILLAGCAGEPVEEPQPAAPAKPSGPTETAETTADPEAALEELRAEYVRQYNLGHAEMVADLHTADGLMLDADGAVVEGRDELIARLTAEMEAAPTLALETDETLVLGDTILGRGSWNLEVTPEGVDPITRSGSWVNVVERVGAEWKVALVTTNDAAPAPAGTPAGADPKRPPETSETNEATADLAARYVEHFNRGDASMVADLFAEDGVAMYAESEPVEGREAILADVESFLTQGSSQIAVHQTGVSDIVDGWVVATGWYELELLMDGETVTRRGNYTTVNEPTGDGGYLIRWVISNAPDSGM